MGSLSRQNQRFPKKCISSILGENLIEIDILHCETGLPSRSPTWITGTQYFKYHLLLPRVHITSKLDWKQRQVLIPGILIWDAFDPIHSLTQILTPLPILYTIYNRLS